ncbi:DUF3553 domain-containing protein [Geomonas paludis]|uniref:DUF3553 domain-containing protein n=1 Tax=Geomonas paludis TaxID=2740185 RepID=A0A6V8MZD7_9BACT|nr:DUF3553 domain-containing protein [Geomonas paludis]UPU34634.1 DUF3553 domain-containing protein [Geomonas paludis]GFO65007.1 hypothetical protein GMPD_29260 [Geomonas paludis]
MTIRRGDVVSHCGAVQWGVGKVVEIGENQASIHFNDGVFRKIAASHFSSLLPAEAASFTPPPPATPEAKPVKAPKAPKAASARQKKS